MEMNQRCNTHRDAPASAGGTPTQTTRVNRANLHTKVSILSAIAVAGVVVGCPKSESPFLEHVRDWELLHAVPNSDTVRFSPNGDRFLVANEPGHSIDVFAIASGELVARLKTDQTFGADDRPLAYSPDGTRIASGGEDPALQIWDAKTFGLARSVDKATLLKEKDVRLSIWTVSWSADSSRIVATTLGEDALVFDAKSLTVVATLLGHTDTIRDARYSPRGDLIATVSWDTTVGLWDAKTNLMLARLSGHPDRVCCLAWSASGDILATGGIATAKDPARVVLWDMKTRTAIRNLEQYYDLEAVRFSKDGERVESYDRYEMHVWDIATGRRLVKANRSDYAFGKAVYSPDGKHLIAADGQDLKIWARRDSVKSK